MKALFLITTCFTLLVFHNLNSQSNFHVVQINGKIDNISVGKKLDRGDKVGINDQIGFSEKKSSAIIIGEGRKYRLQESSSMEDNQAFLSKLITPIISRNQLISRGNRDSLTDLNSYFGDCYGIIGDTIKINIKKSHFNLDDKRIILANYLLNNESVSIKLNNNSGQLVFDKEGLLKGNKYNKIDNFEIYLFNLETKEADKIATTSIIFVDKRELEESFKVINDVLNNQGKGYNEKEKYLKGYFIDIYGYVDENSFSELLKNIAL